MVDLEQQMEIAIEAWEEEKAELLKVLETQQQLIDTQQRAIEQLQEGFESLQQLFTRAQRG